MRVRHPTAAADTGVVDDVVYVDGDAVTIDDEGCFEAPEAWCEAFAERYDTELDSLRVADTHDCGVNGCSRDVDSPEATCWQHEDT